MRIRRFCCVRFVGFSLALRPVPDSLRKLEDEITIRIDANTIKRMKQIPVDDIWLEQLEKLATSGVYGVEEPRECYMTYTTERAEKEAVKLYKRELRCSHQEASEAYCEIAERQIQEELECRNKVQELSLIHI